MKQRLITACLAAVLSLTLICSITAQADWDDGIIFTAVNYNVLPLTKETMPVLLGGTIYVPYTVFDANLNGVGVSLGLFNGGQDKVKGTYTLYSRDNSLTFDLVNNVVWDYFETGDIQESIPQAIIRNGTIYLPVVAVCRHFGLSTYYTIAPIGYPIIRIKNENYVLEDDQFINAASTTMATRLKDYETSVNPVISPSTTATAAPSNGSTVSPSTSTSPSVSPSASISPSVSVSPSPDVELPEDEEEVVVDRSHVILSLAFLCDTGQAGTELIDTLQNQDKVALFLFSPDQLMAQDDFVRRVVAEGHSLGLIVTGETLEEVTAQAELGNQLLSTIAYSRSRILYLDSQTILPQDITSLGYVCWESSLEAIPGDNSFTSTFYTLNRSLALMDSQTHITMDDSDLSSQTLTRLLQVMVEDQYSYQAPLETALRT